MLRIWKLTALNRIFSESFRENIIDDKAVQDEVGYEKYDVVTANILADVIMPLSKEIAQHIKHGGVFITSGNY